MALGFLPMQPQPEKGQVEAQKGKYLTAIRNYKGQNHHLDWGLRGCGQENVNHSSEISRK